MSCVKQIYKPKKNFTRKKKPLSIESLEIKTEVKKYHSDNNRGIIGSLLVNNEFTDTFTNITIYAAELSSP